MTTVPFATYYSGIVNIDVNEIDEAMTTETIFPYLYSYYDSKTGLTFVKISKAYLICFDTNYSFAKLITQNFWKIYRNTSFSSLENIIFVAQADNPSDQTKWKNINQVLALYNYPGELPISSFQDVYMKVIEIKSSAFPNYITGTFFTPNQPYIKVKYVGPESIVSHSTDTTIKYNTIVDGNSGEGVDGGVANPQLITINPTAGYIRLGLAGRYLITANASLVLEENTLPTPRMINISAKLNNNIILKQNLGWIGTVNNYIQGSVNITDVIDIKETDLVTENRANLFFTVFSSWTGSAVQLKAGELTTASVYFLG